MTVQVVWFKRDLRVSDHQALYQASHQGPVLCCYLIESDYWQLPDTSNRQWLFVRESLIELAEHIAKLGGFLLVAKADACQFLARLQQQIGSFVLHSHQETGNLWTYQRDKAVARWCQEFDVVWHEYPQHAVVRGKAQKKLILHGASGFLRRSGLSTKQTHRQQTWREHWQEFVKIPCWPKPKFQAWPDDLIHQLDCKERIQLAELPLQVTQDAMPFPPYRQVGGRTAAVQLFKGFLAERGARYQATISSPLTAEHGCSRLSPHLAYGTVSIRELLRQLELTLQQRHERQWRKSLQSFQSRLVWHCYFMQKLEANPAAEQRNMHKLYDALNRPWQHERFLAWQYGQTGWPLVDACMRYLIANGWLNFRMRAMLVSVACYTLKLPWQPVAHWLAKLFVDYEPGIHYPQIQMQSGTNGNQVLRIYNPLSQAQELDPDGVFVRRWVSELQHVPTTWVFTPEKMPSQLKQQYGCEHYPVPLVDFVSAHRAAKQEITELRHRTMAKSIESESSKQFSLFDESC
jgi:deoxyribodipyrimidine photo-lyase